MSQKSHQLQTSFLTTWGGVCPSGTFFLLRGFHLWFLLAPPLLLSGLSLSVQPQVVFHSKAALETLCLGTYRTTAAAYLEIFMGSTWSDWKSCGCSLQHQLLPAKCSELCWPLLSPWHCLAAPQRMLCPSRNRAALAAGATGTDSSGGRGTRWSRRKALWRMVCWDHPSWPPGLLWLNSNFKASSNSYTQASSTARLGC